MKKHPAQNQATMPLLLLTAILVGIGLLLLYSAGQVSSRNIADLFSRQVAWAVAGLTCLLVVARADFRGWTKRAPAIFLCGLVLLVGVLFLGRGRAHRWLQVGGFFFQPSEFFKLVFILTLAWYLEARRRAAGQLGTLLTALFFIFLPPALLILIQPNLGTAFILLPVFLAMCYAAGTPRRQLLALLGTGLSLLPLLWLFLKDYQKARILVFINPGADPLGAGYNILQSRIAIGSGGLWGKGFLQGTQTHLAFLPEHHTDFIFSVLAEEWGLAGGLVLILIYLVFINQLARAAILSRNRTGALIITGCTAMFATQAIINIAMTMGFLPVVGIPLPFLSYGGSSLVVSMTAVGLVISVCRRAT